MVASPVSPRQGALKRSLQVPDQSATKRGRRLGPLDENPRLTRGHESVRADESVWLHLVRQSDDQDHSGFLLIKLQWTGWRDKFFLESETHQTRESNLMTGQPQCIAEDGMKKRQKKQYLQLFTKTHTSTSTNTDTSEHFAHSYCTHTFSSIRFTFVSLPALSLILPLLSINLSSLLLLGRQ